MHTASRCQRHRHNSELYGKCGAALLTQNGPETPYRYATPDDCSSVAAQVQEETTADATRPDLTVLPAVLNISEV